MLKALGCFDRAAEVLTLHASKGLEFPVVALVGAGHMPAPGEDEREEAKLFYVGATRATQRLIVGLGGEGRVRPTSERLSNGGFRPPDC